MASALGMGVIAEGVESEAQADSLRALGCPLAQGFHLGPPV
jgi:diguanylate cyclase